MAYTPTNWKDRVVDRPRTYTIQNNADGTITLIPEPGVVHEAGTPVNSGNMNKIEQAIDSLDSVVEAASVVLAGKADYTKPQIINPYFSKDSVGQQLRIGAWGDLSDNNAGHTIWANNAFTDASGVIRYSNAHPDLGAKGLRMAYGSRNLQFFDTGSVKTVAGQAFTPAWRNVALKKDFHVKHPHIDTNAIWLDNLAGWFEEDGNTVTIVASINIPVYAISVNKAYPVINNGENGVDVEANGVYTFVLFSGSFYLRSGGGGGTGASTGKLKLLASTIIPGHQIAGYNYAGQVVHAKINVKPSNVPTTIPAVNNTNSTYLTEVKKLNETTYLAIGLTGRYELTVLRRSESQLSVVTRLDALSGNDPGWLTILDSNTFLMFIEKYQNPTFIMYKYNEAAGTITPIGTPLVAHTGYINNGNSGSSIILDGNRVMFWQSSNNYRVMSYNTANGAMSWVDTSWKTVSYNSSDWALQSSKTTLTRSGNYILATNAMFLRNGSSYCKLCTFTKDGVFVSDATGSISISGLDWSSTSSTLTVKIAENYIAVAVNGQYATVSIFYINPVDGKAYGVASINMTTTTNTNPRSSINIIGVANGKINGFVRRSATQVSPFQLSYTLIVPNPPTVPVWSGSITNVWGTDITLPLDTKSNNFAWPMVDPLLETPYGHLYANSGIGGTGGIAPMYWYVPNALINTFATVDTMKPIGIVTNYVSANSAATIATKGLVKGVGALSAGNFYYQAPEGWLSPNATSNVISPIRMAYSITATTLYMLDNYLSLDTRVGKVSSDSQVDLPLSNAVAAGKAVVVNNSGVMSAFNGLGQPIGMSNGSKLVIKGIVKGLSGLYPSREYFLDASGNLTQTETSRYVGIAISSTELLMSKDLFN